jgi:lactoylglutathione lyase
MTASQATPTRAGTLLDLVRHVSAAVSVRDLDRSVDWYTDKLGFDVVATQDFPAIGARVAYLRHGDTVLELVRSTPAVAVTRPAPPYNYVVLGWAQLSLAVDDIQQARLLAGERGLTIVSDIVTAPDLGVTVFVTQDLDGNLIEIAQLDWMTS